MLPASASSMRAMLRWVQDAGMEGSRNGQYPCATLRPQQVHKRHSGSYIFISSMCISYISTIDATCTQRKIHFVCGINCPSNKYMNRYLKKRHDYNRFNYCHLSFNVLAPKVLLILPFLQTKSEYIPA